MEQQIRIWQGISWKAISDRTKDLVIALIISTIGLIGTYLILGKSIHADAAINNEINSDNNNVFASNSNISGTPKSSNEDLLIIQGIFLPDQMLKVTYMEYGLSKKYMIDFGNGIRQISKSPSTYIKYQQPGIYYILFYELMDEKWEIVSSQAITIKS
ncbi:MAG: hypothetical protein ABI851_05805 [Saprospiraceae bacterium]